MFDDARCSGVPILPEQMRIVGASSQSRSIIAASLHRRNRAVRHLGARMSAQIVPRIGPIRDTLADAFRCRYATVMLSETTVGVAVWRSIPTPNSATR